MASLIEAGSSAVNVVPADGKKFTLKEMYELIGCSLVEMISLRDGRTMWMDEEGKFKDPHVLNSLATTMLREAGGAPGDYVAGTVLICTPGEVS